MHTEPFEYERPISLREFESILAKHGAGANILAGGTDLLVLVKEKLLSPRILIDIGNLRELMGVSWDDGKGLTILAGTKVAAIERNALVKEKAPALAYAAAQLGSSQVRHMATLAGNCCHGSPSAESPPVFLAHDASVVLAREGSERTLPISDFWLAYRKTALAPGEYLKSFVLPPLPDSSAVAYRFKGLRGAMEIDMVNVAAYLELEGDGKTVKAARIAMGAVGPIPYRAKETEKKIAGKTADAELFARAGELASEEAKPIDDVRASAAYRKKLVKILTARALEDAFKSITEGK